jgi:hypothetical protein
MVKDIGINTLVGNETRMEGINNPIILAPMPTWNRKRVKVQNLKVFLSQATCKLVSLLTFKHWVGNYQHKRKEIQNK